MGKLGLINDGEPVARVRHRHGFEDLRQRLDALRRDDMHRARRRLAGRQGREVVVDGRRLVNFCSNDYLGLAGDRRVAEALKRGVERWGVGSGASHLICGHTHAHAALEEAVAAFTGRPRALVFGSGYAANMGAINALLTVGDHVFEDRLNHASLLDGGWISRADFHWCAHRDVDDLNARLEGVAASPARKLIASDGTFSMDGDQCRLDEWVAAAKRHRAWLHIDDAHGMGVGGAGGVGLVDPARHGTGDVAVLVGTFGKAFGTSGAFVAGEDALIETLVQRARSYVFTTAMPSALAVATRASLALAQAEAWRRERLRALVARFRAGLTVAGHAPSASTSPIQPLVVGEPSRALRLSRGLEARGFLVGAIRPPTVPEGASRLRVTLSAAHREDDVDRLLEALHALREGAR